MPEIGDEVRFHLPSEYEHNAYIVSSTHLEASSTTERANPDHKSIMNKYKKEILFTPSSIKITNNAGLSIELLDDEGIRIVSNKAIVFKADEAIHIASVKDTLQVVAPKAVVLQQNGTTVELNDKITFAGAQVHIV